MAQGDVVTIIPTQLTTSGTTQFLDMKPTTGEWTIHNIVYGGSVELYKTDGTNSIKWAQDASNGGFMGMFLHCTATSWYQIKNVGASNIYVSYDGVVTK